MRRCVFAIVAALAACSGGPNADAICQERETCQHGNDLDVDACVVSFTTSRELAGNLGCSEEFDAWFECFETTASCVDTPTGFDCVADEDCPPNPTYPAQACQNGRCVDSRYDVVDTEACKSERAAYRSCTEAG